MLIRFDDLVTLDLAATDGSRHRINDVFVTGEDIRIAYVVAHVGGWFSGGNAVVPIERFGTPDIANTVWPCDLDEAALSETDGREGAPPPCTLVPEGALPSPECLGDARTPAPGEALHSMSRLIGMASVHASDDEVGGDLMDVIFEPKDWRLGYLVVETPKGAGLSRNQRVVQANRIERIDFATGRVSLGLSLQEVHRAPDLHEIDDVEGKWYNKVLAYYGISAT